MEEPANSKRPTHFKISLGQGVISSDIERWRELAHCVTDEADQVDYDKRYDGYSQIVPASDSGSTSPKEGWLSFRNIKKLINDQKIKGDTKAKLKLLREDILKAYKSDSTGDPEKDSKGRVLLSDKNGKAVVFNAEDGKYYYVNEDDDGCPLTEEYKGNKTNLRTCWETRRPNKDIKFKSTIAKDLYDDRFSGRGIGDEANAQANVLMMLDEEALEFFEKYFEEHKDDATCDELWSSFVASNFPNLRKRLEGYEKLKKLEAKGITPSYSLTKGKLTQTYKNIGGENGLKVTIIDNRLSILTTGTDVKPISKLTKQQYTDLLALLESRGNEIEVDDETKKALQAISVVDDAGKPYTIYDDSDSPSSLYDHFDDKGIIKGNKTQPSATNKIIKFGLEIKVTDEGLVIEPKDYKAKGLFFITADQYNDLLNALEQTKDIKISDEIKEALKDIKVVTSDGKLPKSDPNNPNSSACLYDHLVHEGIIEHNYNDEEENEASGGTTFATPSNDDVAHFDGSGSYTPNNSSDSPLKDDGVEFDSFRFAGTKSNPKEYKEIRNKFLKEFKRAHVDDLIDVRLGIGGFEIVSWGSEEDKYHDGRIDPKTGIKADKRGFGCKFKYGPPPSATLTSGNLKKMSKTDAAAILKGLKAAGALYVTIPGKETLGAEGFKNTLMATISAGIVPRLGDGPNASSGIGKGEAAEIWKTLKDADRKVSEKIDYALRFSEQLYIHDDALRRAGKEPEFASYPAFYLQYARFGNFNETYFDNLIEFKGVKTKAAVRGEDGKWHLTDEVIDLSQGQTDVDKICAKYAMTQIINNISKGKIPQLDENGNIITDAAGTIQFEPYDPIDKDHNVEEKLQKVMSAYMVAEKINVLTKIDTEYNEANNTKYGDTKRDDKAISKVYKQYTTEYAYAIETMEKYQVKLTDTKNFDVQLLSNTKGYTPPAIDNSGKNGVTNSRSKEID